MYKTDYKTANEIVNDFKTREAEFVNLINKTFANLNYRHDYNKKKNAIYKQVKSDPRFNDLLKTVKK